MAIIQSKYLKFIKERGKSGLREIKEQFHATMNSVNSGVRALERRNLIKKVERKPRFIYAINPDTIDRINRIIEKYELEFGA